MTKVKKISRREFISAVAAATGATMLVACFPIPNRKTEGTTEPGVQPPAGDIPLQPTPAREYKVCVVYDSVYGNTGQIAQALLEGMWVHHESRVFKAQEVEDLAVTDIDLLLVGSPTHGGTYTEPVKNFLAQIPDQGLAGVRAAAFDTSFSKETQGAVVDVVIDVFGFAAPKIGEQLSKKGAEVLSAETFIVLDTEGPLKDGEIKRAGQWISDMIAIASMS